MTSTLNLANQSFTPLKKFSVFDFNSRSKFNVMVPNKCNRKASTDSLDSIATADTSINEISQSSFSPYSDSPREGWECQGETGSIFNSAIKPKKKVVTDETKYKTELCKKFAETNYCPYGKKCKFAHGKEELNEKFLSNKRRYKSKKCNTFHTNMTCPYGSRCLFAHEQRNVEELQADNFYEKFLFCPEVLPSVANKKRLPCFSSAIDTEARQEKSILNLSSCDESEVDEEEFNFILQLSTSQ